MKPHIEKRACRRNNFIASITCTYFNADRFYAAKTTNHSKEGLQFDSDFPLKPGASIYLRLEDLLPMLPTLVSFDLYHLLRSGGVRRSPILAEAIIRSA